MKRVYVLTALVAVLLTAAGCIFGYGAVDYIVPAPKAETNLEFATRTVAQLKTLAVGQSRDEVMERMREKYKISIEAQFPDREAVEKLERNKGMYSFRESVENRKECCNIRKVIPLNRALEKLDAWITGLRTEQSMTRTETEKIQQDTPRKGIVWLRRNNSA